MLEQSYRTRPWVCKVRFGKSTGFQSIRHVSPKVKGIETVYALYKQRRSLQPNFAFSVYHELKKLLVVA